MINYLKYSENKTSFIIGILIGILSSTIGAVLSYSNIWIASGIVVSFALISWALMRSEIILWSAIAISLILPFGTLPLKLIITPTFLDITLVGIYAIFIASYITKYPKTLSGSPVHAPIIVFILLSIICFILGLANSFHSLNLFRKFTVFILNIGLSIVVVEQTNNLYQLNKTLKIIIYSGFVAAMVGIVLYFLPPDLSQQLLNYLGIINYPTGNVLRYIEDNPENPLRAIGTSVDPNMFGGILAVVGTILIPQIIHKPSLIRNKLTSLFILSTIVLALFLTYSRTAMTAFLISTIFIVFMTNRKLLWTIVLIILIITLLPWSHQYLSHFIHGISGNDLATNMRFGEYKDAIILISRYPVFGVGFGGAPDIDVYLGVSSAYLLLSEQVGLVGFSSFATILIILFTWGIKNKSRILSITQLSSQWIGIYGAILTTTIVGLFDHYFVNLEFQASQTFFWIIIGLSIVTTKLSQ